MTSLLAVHRQRLIYQAALLGGACFLVSLLLLIGNLATHKSIEFHAVNDRKVLLQQVLPPQLYDNDPLSEAVQLPAVEGLDSPPTIYVARKQERINGAGIAAAIQGWGGVIDFILAVNGDGEITGVRIISHKETPGLADKIEIEKSEWITSFNGKSLGNTSEPEWHVKKDQGQFDQFTGATITPRAVVKGVHLALQAYGEWRSQQILKPAKTEAGQ